MKEEGLLFARPLDDIRIKVKHNSREKFVHDFAGAWSKVMNLDRFDLA